MCQHEGPSSAETKLKTWKVQVVAIALCHQPDWPGTSASAAVDPGCFLGGPWIEVFLCAAGFLGSSFYTVFHFDIPF